MIAKALLHQTVCHKSDDGMIGIGREGAVYLVKIINDSSLLFWPYISRHLGKVGNNADQFALFRIVDADVVLALAPVMLAINSTTVTKYLIFICYSKIS